MRAVLLADLVTVARVLMAIPDAERAATLDRLIYRAHAAHVGFKRLGKPHPQWGNGGLTSAAAGLERRREPFATDPEYLAVLGLVITTLAARGRRKRECRGRGLGLLPATPMC